MQPLRASNRRLAVCRLRAVGLSERNFLLEGFRKLQHSNVLAHRLHSRSIRCCQTGQRPRGRGGDHLGLNAVHHPMHHMLLCCHRCTKLQAPATCKAQAKLACQLQSRGSLQPSQATHHVGYRCMAVATDPNLRGWSVSTLVYTLLWGGLGLGLCCWLIRLAEFYFKLNEWLNVKQ